MTMERLLNGRLPPAPVVRLAGRHVMLLHVAGAKHQTRQSMADRVFDNLESASPNGHLLSEAR